MGGISELPFIPEDTPEIQRLLNRAILAIECENSLWKAAAMPDYGAILRPQKRLGGKPGLKKNAVLPTVILKEEDRLPLLAWQGYSGIPIHIWHVFFDMAYGLSLDNAQKLLDEGLIQPTEQTFQAPGGAVSKKILYKFYYHYAYALGRAENFPELKACYIEDKNGHILPYVRFDGGNMRLNEQVLGILEKAANAR